MRVKSLIFMAYTLAACGCVSASPRTAPQTTQPSEFSAKCGVTVMLPAQLLANGQGELRKCTGSYSAPSGAVLSLAPVDSSAHNPGWIDRIPMLHIRRIGIDEIIKKNEESIFYSNPIGRKVVAVNAPQDCKLKSRSTIKEISGENWHGWLAEDIYEISGHNTSRPEYCQQYLGGNRCVRMVIGNSRVSITMAQYCLAGNPNDFDLESGLSYDIFLKIIETINFSER